jgi:signal transduction histidine kinase
VSPRAARVVSRSILGLSIALMTLTIPLSLAASNRAEPGRIVVVGDPTARRMAEVRADLEARVAAGDDLMPSFNRAALVLALIVLLWLATGAVIVSRQPSNWAGWIFITIGLAFPLTAFCEAVIAFGVRSTEEPVPGATVAAVVGEFALYPVALLPLLFLWFPDGRPPSPRWRWASRALMGGVGLALVGFVVRPGPLNNWVDMGTLYENPLGVDGLGEMAGVLIGVGTITALLAAFSTVLAVRQRFKRSTGEERQRMRWLVFVATAAGVLLALQFLLLPATLLLGVWKEAGPDPLIFDIGFGLVAFIIALGVPGAYLVAILRYRLWDLDLAIRKAVVFAVLAGFITVLYALVAVGVPTLVVGVDGGSGPYTLVATVLLMLLFQPVRERARRVADRLVYGKRATPYEVLTDFSERVAGTYSTEDILPRMATILAEGVGAESSSVWLRVGNELRPEATWPAHSGSTGRTDALRLSGDEVPPFPEREHAVEVRHQGELLGALSVRMPASDPMNPAKATLVRDLAAQAGLVLRNARLIEELRASRRRLVAAQDEERRRIERNIHDGAQQQLVALSVKLGLMRNLLDRDTDQARRLVDEVQHEAIEVLDDLRDLARGVYPPLLADQGLAAALEAQARKAPVRVTVEVDALGRYSQEVEAAVYFCALEALQNVAKYAGASLVRVRLAQSDGQLTFEVEDDGGGFDPDTTKSGSGLTNMADRLEALGGALRITSSPGQGTSVTGRIPVETR